MDTINKTFSYIGFALKARQCKCGVNAIKTIKKGVELLIVCYTAETNTLKEAKALSDKYGCPLIMSKTFTVENAVHKDNCKLIAIMNKDLAQAILNNSDCNYEGISGGSAR